MTRDRRMALASLTRERLEAAASVLVAIGVQLLMPEQLVLGPILLLPAIEAVLLLTLLLGRIRLPEPHHPGLRAVALLLVASIIAATLLATVAIVTDVLSAGRDTSGMDLLRAGLGVWVTNVIAFALLYWELDMGGPALRALPDDRPAGRPGPRATDASGQPVPDFLFPQYDSSRSAPGWRPVYADYLYTSFTNATAFSPTDTMPLRHRAKLLMAAQSIIALVTVAFLFARAVNVLR